VTFPCPQCGAEVRLQETTGFVRCPYCGTSLALEATGVHRHHLYRPRLRPGDVLPLLRRFCDARGAAPPTLAASPRLTYYPFWRYAGAGGGRLVPAWPTVDARWRDVTAPDAEQVLFDSTLIGPATLIEAAVEERAARARVSPRGDGTAGDLVHVPFYDLEARVGTARIQLSLDACSGLALTGDVPTGPRARRSAETRWLPATAFALMVLLGALMPTWWLAATCIFPLAILLHWSLTAGRSAEAQGRKGAEAQEHGDTEAQRRQAAEAQRR
jgi:hypothetical protein